MSYASLRLALATVIVLGSLPAAALTGELAGYPPAGDVTYAVFRNGDQIGTHEMDFIRDGNRYRVVTRINIAVTVLGMTFFRFITNSDEVWIDGKFASFVAKTNYGGALHDLTIRPAGDGLEVVDNGNRKILGGNLLPATLWNPASLKATQLIDPTDGAAKKVRIVDRGSEQITVRGRPIVARHVSFTGEIPREVWYGPDDRIVYMEYHGPDGSLVVTQLP
jgi:hypothetical protein